MMRVAQSSGRDLRKKLFRGLVICKRVHEIAGGSGYCSQFKLGNLRRSICDLRKDPDEK